MIRREFIAFLAGVGASWPTRGRAQQRFRIGLLDTGLGAAFSVPFTRKLTELGYVEGRNLVLERKSAEGDVERLNGLAAELVRDQVDLIVTPAPQPDLPQRRARARSQSSSELIAIRSASAWLQVSPAPVEI
jgi:putative ABC transport system substrate-binding protein